MRGSHRVRIRRLGGNASAAAATLNQQRKKHHNVRGQHDEENVAKPFPALMLDLNGSDGGSRNLKWIEFFHSFVLPSQ